MGSLEERLARMKAGEKEKSLQERLAEMKSPALTRTVSLPTAARAALEQGSAMGALPLGLPGGSIMAPRTTTVQTATPRLLPTGRKPAGVNMGYIRAEAEDRRRTGDFTLPGGREDRVAALERKETEVRSVLTSLQQPNGGIGTFNAGANEARTARIKKLQGQLEELAGELTAEKDAAWREGQVQDRRSLEGVRARPGFQAAALAGAETNVDLWGRWAPGRRLAAELVNPSLREHNRNMGVGSEADQLDALTDEERDTLLYYIGMGEYDKVQEYFNLLERDLNARRQAGYTAEDAAQAEAHPFQGAAKNVLASFASPLAYMSNALQTGKNAITGAYEPTDPNSDGFRGAHMVNATAQGVSQAGTRMPLAGGIEIAGKNVGSFLAETGLSMGQFAAKLPTGAMALPLMGAGAAGQTTLDVLERGGTNGQAFAMGTANGLIEIATEKIGLDHLFAIAGRTGAAGVKRALLDVGGQMLAEGSEEAISEAAGNLVDLAVMGDKSGVKQYAAQLVAEGMSQSEAESAALKQFFLVNTGWAAAGGALSGGAMGGAATAGRGLMTGAEAAALEESDVLRMPLPTEGGTAPIGQKKTASTRETAYRAEIPQNVELPTVPIINLSMEDVAELNQGVLPDNGGYLRKTAIQRAKVRLGLDQNSAAYIPASNVLRNGDEYILKITKASLDKMFHPSDGGTVPVETVAIMENLERIANNGVYFRSEGDRKGRDQIRGVDHLMTTVYIDGAPYVVDMRVRVAETGLGTDAQNVLYYFTPEEITAIKKADGGTPAAGRHASDGEVPPSSNNRIAQSNSAVNLQSAQNLESHALAGPQAAGGLDHALPGVPDSADWAVPLGGTAQIGSTSGKPLLTAQAAAQPVLARRELVAGLVGGFSIPMGSKKAAAEKIGAIAGKMMEQGYVSDGDLEGLFDALYDAGQVQVEDGSWIEYRDIRQWLKGNRVYVPPEVKADFGDDWNAFRTETMGSGIILTNEAKSQGIDSLYGELQDTFGAGIFPENTDLSTMLRGMVEVARMGRVEFEGLEDAAYRQGGAESAARQREDMSLRMAQLVERFSDMAGLELRLKAKSAEDLSLMRKRYQDQAKTQAQRQKVRVEQIQARYHAVEENRKAQRRTSAARLEALRETRRQAKEKSPLELENVKELLANSEGLVMPSGASYAGALTGKGVSYSKDLGRNLDAASGGNVAVRDWLRDLIERPVLGAKKNYAKSVKTQLDGLKQTMDGLGIKAGSPESAAVQRIGEGQYQDKFGVVHPYTLDMLKKEFPTKWQNIQRAEREARKTYDAYVGKINDALAQVYPNALEAAQKELTGLHERETWHKGQMDNQRALCHTWEDKIAKLTQVLDGKTASPVKRAEMEKSLATARRNLDNGLKRLDQYAAMAEDAGAKVQAVTARIDSGDVLRNKRLLKRKDYFHHFNEMAQGWAGLAHILTTPNDINASLAGVSDFTAPKSKWAGFLQQRLGGTYTEDAVGGLLQYIPQAEYKINLDPIIAQNRGVIKALALETEDSRNANRFIEWMTDWTNDLAGKTNPLDRPLQKLVGRKSMAALKWLSSRAKSNAVMGNVRSAVAQVFNLPNAAAYIKSPKAWAKGAGLYSRQLAGSQSARAVLDESGFLAERYLDSAISQFDEGILKAPEKFANWMLTVGDREATRLTWCAAFEDARRKNHADPVEYADDVARRSVGGRGIGEIPLTQKATLTQLLAPFQVEVNNTWQLMKEKAGAKDVVGLTLLFAISALMNGVIRELFGFDVGIDLFHAAVESAEDWEEDNPAGNALTTLGRLGGELVSNMPFGAQFGQFLVPDDGDRQKIFGDADPTRFGTGNIGVNALADTALSAWNAVQEKDPSKLDLMTPLTTFAMPFGGRQLERGIDAGQTMGWLPRGTEDGFARLPDAASYSAGGGMRFPVDEESGVDVAKLFAFGPFSTAGGMEYSNNNWLPLSEEQTAAAESAARKGVDLTDYVPLVREMAAVGRLSEKLDILDGSALPDEQKAVIYYETIASDTEIALMDALEWAGVPAGVVYAALSGLQTAGGQGEGATDRKREALVEMDGLSDEDKARLGGALLGDTRELDYSSQAALDVSLLPDGPREKAGEAEDAGIGAEAFLGAYEAQKGIVGDKNADGNTIPLSASRKKKNAIDYATPGLSTEQREMLYELFGVSKNVW